MKLLLILHRYLGVTVGVLMVVWCLSGFVMMYQAMPALTAAERVQGLAPLSLATCCDLSKLKIAPDVKVGGFQVEMLNGDPVLRLQRGGERRQGGDRRFSGRAEVYNLRTGDRIAPLSDVDVLHVAADYGRGLGIVGPPRLLPFDGLDQWTLQTARRNHPVRHVGFDGPGGHEIYISGATGEVFQDSSRVERIVAWFGAVPHWLYPTVLRQNGPLWTQVVIWSSLIGVFLTATGLYVGIARFKKRKDGRWSPFRGWWYWHHMIGLVFGVLTLTWVFSGLMTMNPWGVLEGARSPIRSQFINTASWRDVGAFLEAAKTSPALGDVKQLRAAPLDGRLFVAALNGAGGSVRLNAAARPQVLQRAEVEATLAKLPQKPARFELLRTEDAYYYSHHNAVDLPVYRAILADAEQTRLYLSAQDGSLSRLVGKDARTSRWIRNGLHGLDFPVLRIKPVWHIAVGLLLAGVTAGCVTGAWLSFKRIGRDAGRLGFSLREAWRRVRRRVAKPA